MATAATLEALRLGGNLNFGTGGMSIDYLVGAFIKSAVFANGTWTLTFQNSAGIEDTLDFPPGWVVAAVAPENPYEGQGWYDTTAGGGLKIYSGAVFAAVMGAAGAGADATARASIVAETTARVEADRAEAIVRAADDVTLGDSIGNEATARAAADVALTADVAAADAKAVDAKSSIAAETTAREDADRDEAITRDEKDVALGHRVTNEATARIEKDTALDTAVAAADAKAVAARVAADTGVLAATANTTEIAAVKVTADAAQTAAEVDADVLVETTARIAADAALGARITALDARIAALPASSSAPTRALYIGWSAIKNITAVAALSTSSDSHVVTVPPGVGNLYFALWRADVDGGDPAEVYLSGGGSNIRNLFEAATDFSISFAGTVVPGKLIVTGYKQNTALWAGQVLRLG